MNFSSFWVALANHTALSYFKITLLCTTNVKSNSLETIIIGFATTRIAPLYQHYYLCFPN